jgi:predicted HicB family RNase H-like nuclease
MINYGGFIMFKIKKLERKKTEHKQFTITIDKKFYGEIKQLAEKNEQSLHGFVVSLLYSYKDYSNKLAS